MRRVPKIADLGTHASLRRLTGSTGRWRAGRERLSTGADAGAAAACVTIISFLEFGEAVQRGTSQLDDLVDGFVSRTGATASRYWVLLLTGAIAGLPHGLCAIPEREARVIVATTQSLGYPIVTRDSAIVARTSGDRGRGVRRRWPTTRPASALLEHIGIQKGYRVSYPRTGRPTVTVWVFEFRERRGPILCLI